MKVSLAPLLPLLICPLLVDLAVSVQVWLTGLAVYETTGPFTCTKRAICITVPDGGIVLSALSMIEDVELNIEVRVLQLVVLVFEVSPRFEECFGPGFELVWAHGWHSSRSPRFASLDKTPKTSCTMPLTSSSVRKVYGEALLSG